jgi:hypothetical protein
MGPGLAELKIYGDTLPKGETPVVKPVELSGDVVTGASALAGLFLVYLGNVATGFGSYEKQAQAAVRRGFQIRGWLAVAGIVLAILSAVLALVGKWSGSNSAAAAAIVLLLAALIFGAAIALIAARDIR